MAGREGGIDPFQEHDTRRPRYTRRTGRDRIDPPLQSRHSRPAKLRNAGRVGHRLKTREHLGKTRRLEIDDARIPRQPTRRRGHLRFSDRADIAQRLGDDEIGGEMVEHRQIELVERPLRAKTLADELVDLPARRVGGNERLRHAGQAADPLRMVAFVGYADERLTEPELADDLGSARQERDNPHVKKPSGKGAGEDMMERSVAGDANRHRLPKRAFSGGIG